MMKELTVQEPKIIYTTPTIDFSNVSQLETQLGQFLSRFDGYQVTRESLSSDKKTLAELNKLAKSLEDNRKDVKGQILIPVKDFETAIKHLVGMIDQVTANIKDGIKFYEDKAKQDRHNQRYARMVQIAGDAEVDPDLIEYNPRWDNKTFNNQQFEENINFQIDRIINEREHFEANKQVIESKARELLLPPQTFIDSLSYKELPTVLKEMDLAKQQIDQLSEESRKREEAKLAAEKSNEVIKGNKVIDKTNGEIKDEIRKWKIAMVGTKTQLMSVKQFLVDNGIEYEVIK